MARSDSLGLDFFQKFYGFMVMTNILGSIVSFIDKNEKDVLEIT